MHTLCSGVLALRPRCPSPGLLSPHLSPNRPGLAPTQLASFFGALDSVLRYRATVMQAFKDMGRLTVNESVLSTKDALVLLHKWSLLERDVMLQEALRAAAEKLHNRELLSACGARAPAPRSCSACP